MDFMLPSVEVFTGQQKYFVERNAEGRSVNDATFSLAHPSSPPAIPHWRFSSRDFNDGWEEELCDRADLRSSSPILCWWEGGV